MASKDPAHSVVLLRSGGRTRVVGIGENAFGGRVTAVAADSVTLEFEGRPATVRLSGDSARAARRARTLRGRRSGRATS